MNTFLQFASAILLILLLVSGIYAFQTPTKKAPELNSGLANDIELEKKKAEAFMNEGLWDEAIQTYQAIQKKCTDLGKTELAIDLYEDIFTVFILREDLEFENQLNLIEQVKEAEKHPNLLALYYGAKAHFYAFYGELDSMNKYYTLATDLYQTQNRPKLEASLNNNLAYEFYMLDDLQTAKAFLTKAEKILTNKLIPKGFDLPTIYNTQTIIYAGLGEYEKALKSNLISINTLEKKADASVLDLAYEYNNLAGIYSFLKDYSNSLNYYQKALSLIEKTGEFPIEESASLIYNIGATFVKQGKYSEAKSFFFKSLSYLDKAEDKNTDVLTDYINNYQQLVECFSSLNSLDSALVFIEKAEAINNTFPYRISTTYLKYSEIYLAKKEFDKAIKYIQKAINSGQETYGSKNEFISGAYRTLSNILFEQKDIKEALKHTQKALEAISLDFSDLDNARNPKLENVLFKGELLTILIQKLPILKKLYNEENSNIKSDDIFATAKLATEALEQMNKGMKDLDSKRFWLNTQAIPLFESAIDIAINLAEKTGDAKYTNEAFMLSERSKSMLMTDAMQEANAASFGGVPDSLIEKAQTLQKALDKAEKNRFDARMTGNSEEEKKQDSLIFYYKKELDILKHTFEDKYPKYYELKYQAQVASIEQVQKTLEEGTTFIEYFEGKDKLYAFTINKKTAHIEVIEKADDFQANLFEFQNSLTNIKAYIDKPVVVFNKFVKASHGLYNTLLKDCLKDDQPQRLIIVPDGQLGMLPFEVLLTTEVKQLKQGVKEAFFNELPYTLLDYKISYNYSGTLLLSQQANQQNIINGDILALAPSYANKETPEWRGVRETKLRKGLIELPGAEKEVEMLKELYSGHFFIGQEANEHLFKENATKHGILHLAMHGLVDHKHPEFSGLALTEDNSRNEDNFLYSYEIKQLGLNAGLVVLSACETGIGKYQTGEGVVSLGRGFMYAGAPALMMTLWVLNDQAGKAIIEAFYDNLSKGMEKDEALRQSKLKFLQTFNPEYTHPFMWATFIQVGDYSAISINKKSSGMLYAGGGIALLFLGFIGFKVMRNRRSKAA